MEVRELHDGKHPHKMSDLKNIDKLKSLCSFSYMVKNNFCESISFFDENHIFENTIRRNPFKQEIIKIVSTFPHLKYVNFRKSRIDEFPNFASKEIEYLDLSCNNIDKISEKNLNLPKLKFLNLGSNKIEKIPDLSHLPLETLKLHKNPIKQIPDISIKIKILNLFLCYNLNIVPKTIFKLFNLEVFSFSAVCSVKKLPCFSEFKNLKWLSMPLNELKHFPEDICECLNLEGLILSKNKIKKLPKKIENLKKLKILSLYENSIKELPKSFYKLKLEKLSLEKNLLKNKKQIQSKLLHINFLKI